MYFINKLVIIWKFDDFWNWNNKFIWFDVFFIKGEKIVVVRLDNM